MNGQTTELIAMGASAAVNCHPCMKFHLAKCDELGISRKEVAEAVEVGKMVNRGAAGATRSFVEELLGETAVAEKGAAEKQGCGCA